jgi:hypothetical protein
MLEDRVAALERRLDSLGDEVRTRRLVVVDPDGFERWYTNHSVDAFEVIMASKLPDRLGDPTARVRLYVGEEGGSEEQPTGMAQVYVHGDGHSVELGADAENAALTFRMADEESRSLTGPWLRTLEERIHALRLFHKIAATAIRFVTEEHDTLTE